MTAEQEPPPCPSCGRPLQGAEVGRAEGGRKRRSSERNRREISESVRPSCQTTISGGIPTTVRRARHTLSRGITWTKQSAGLFGPVRRDHFVPKPRPTPRSTSTAASGAPLPTSPSIWCLVLLVYGRRMVPQFHPGLFAQFAERQRRQSRFEFLGNPRQGHLRRE
jgi:hypothetical protein